MRKFTQKYQQVTQKAAEIKQAIQSLPPKVEEIREAISSTASQVRQVHATLQMAMAGLRAEDETMLNQALNELQEGAALLRQAGLELDGVEWEMGVSPKLIVHLRKVASIDLASLRPILAASEQRPAIHALLAALIRAVDMADKTKIPGQTFLGLTVYAGATPSVRLRWGVEAKPAPVIVAAPAPASSAPAPAAPTAFAQTNFFEKRSTPAPEAAKPAETPTPEKPAAASPEVAAKTEAKPEAGDWRRTALDRFKKMPDLTKYRK